MQRMKVIRWVKVEPGGMVHVRVFVVATWVLDSGIGLICERLHIIGPPWNN